MGYALQSKDKDGATQIKRGFEPYHRTSFICSNIFLVVVGVFLLGVPAAYDQHDLHPSPRIQAAGLFLILLSLLGMIGMVKHIQAMLALYTAITFVLFIFIFCSSFGALSLSVSYQLNLIKEKCCGSREESEDDRGRMVNCCELTKDDSRFFWCHIRGAHAPCLVDMEQYFAYMELCLGIVGVFSAVTFGLLAYSAAEYRNLWKQGAHVEENVSF